MSQHIRNYLRILSENFKIKLIGSHNWLYKSEEFKKHQVIQSGLYECQDDYFLAYKAVRSDSYSVYNFQYRFLQGDTYEAHADYTNGENSFGLSVWTKDRALEYHSIGKLLLAKIRYADVARIVHDNGKIRCSKLEVLEEL